MKKEIRKEIREYILQDVNMTLARLGVSEPVKETREWTDKYGSGLEYRFESAPIRQMPMMFKRLVVDGYMISVDLKDGDRYYRLSEDNDIVVVRLGYSYNHFDGGSNGCDIGRVFYSVSKELPESFESDYGDRREYFVRKLEGLEI